MCCSPFFDVWLLITSLLYLLTNVLFTLLWCMASDCPFGKSEAIHQRRVNNTLVKRYQREVIRSHTSKKGEQHIGQKIVSFDQCVVHPSLMYDFWLPPFGIFWPMCCSPFFDVWLLITSLWYLLHRKLNIALYIPPHCFHWVSL
jgi:hypothetical protein